MIPINANVATNKRVLQISQHIPYLAVMKKKISLKLCKKNFCSSFSMWFPERVALKTIVIVPSLTLDKEMLTKVKGYVYYEERMLCLLMLLRMPQTHVVL
jgi:hypothetical protein